LIDENPSGLKTRRYSNQTSGRSVAAGLQTGWVWIDENPSGLKTRPLPQSGVRLGDL
jgi:hypothetical protein